MTLNEEVARALGWPSHEWTLVGSESRGWAMARCIDDMSKPGADEFVGHRCVPSSPALAQFIPDFEHDWNAVYRWIVPAVKEMGTLGMYAFRNALLPDDDPTLFLYATPEDYCRAFLKVKGA